MYLLIWCMFLIAIITSTTGELEDEIKSGKKVNRNKLVQVVSELASEIQTLHQDMQALREEVLKKRNSIVENQEHLILGDNRETIGDNREEQDPGKHGSSAVSGFSLEVLRTEHDTMLHEFQTIREEVQEQRESNVKNQEQLKQILEIVSNIQKEIQQWRTESQEENLNSQIKLSNDVQQKVSTLERGMKHLQSQFSGVQLDYQNCKDVPMKMSGKYKIRVNEKSDQFDAYCDASNSGDNRMVIQWRKDGSQNFNRNWTDYRNGFGDVEGEHWLGLERIHQYTKEHDCELFIEVKDFNGAYKYAKYASFAIGSEAEGYNLKTLGAYSGTAGDSLSYHKGMKFSTPDRDNDTASYSCAQFFGGGWWFGACFDAFLNGLYRNVSGKRERNSRWYTFQNDHRGLSLSRMLILPSN